MQSAQTAIKRIPETTVSVIDSLNISVGQGLIVTHAAKLVKEGKNHDDVIDATYVGVYGYDGNSGDGSNYTIYNNTSTGKIAPGQGFFVAARSSSSANITFKEANI